eukprot:COSAG04_NODE_1145_length_8080_cov_5.594036_2_plen_132_part_00
MRSSFFSSFCAFFSALAAFFLLSPSAAASCAAVISAALISEYDAKASIHRRRLALSATESTYLDTFWVSGLFRSTRNPCGWPLRGFFSTPHVQPPTSAVRSCSPSGPSARNTSWPSASARCTATKEPLPLN